MLLLTHYTGIVEIEMILKDSVVVNCNMQGTEINEPYPQKKKKLTNPMTNFLVQYLFSKPKKNYVQFSVLVNSRHQHL